jgi:hypothetical protein
MNQTGAFVGIDPGSVHLVPVIFWIQECFRAGRVFYFFEKKKRSTMTGGGGGGGCVVKIKNKRTQTDRKRSKRSRTVFFDLRNWSKFAIIEWLLDGFSKTHESQRQTLHFRKRIRFHRLKEYRKVFGSCRRIWVWVLIEIPKRTCVFLFSLHPSTKCRSNSLIWYEPHKCRIMHQNT